MLMRQMGLTSCRGGAVHSLQNWPCCIWRSWPAFLTQLLPPVQHHATDTYAEFVEENEELLKSLPPPVVALEYYRGGDLYYFDTFQTSDRTGDPRRPSCRWV